LLSRHRPVREGLRLGNPPSRCAWDLAEVL